MGRGQFTAYASCMDWEDDPERLDVLPPIVRRALAEVEGCMAGGAYAMATVAARRGLEAICHDQGATTGNLARRLVALKDNGTIDGRLADWATHLRNIGNEGAHDLGFEPDREEASDSRALLRGMVRYVYIDQARYEEAKRRWEYRRLPPLDVSYQMRQFENGCQTLTVYKPEAPTGTGVDDSKHQLGVWTNHVSKYTKPRERVLLGVHHDVWASCRRAAADCFQARNYRLGDWKLVKAWEVAFPCSDALHEDDSPF